MAQPLMDSSKGAIVTIGLVIAGNRSALVMPVATPAQGVTLADVCEQAVDAVHTNIVDLICGLISTDAYVSFVEAHGMDNGAYPFRRDYAPLDKPGTEVADALPPQVGALVCFYQETADVVPGERMKHSRMVLPGITEGQVTNAYADATLITDMQTLADTLVVDGFPSSLGTNPTFYRVLSAPPGGVGAPLAAPLMRIGQSVPRRYLGTQRRRVLPH